MSSENDDDAGNSCSMTGLLSIIIQIGLGALSFSVLIIKRLYEDPKRPWKIWTLDASKQMISQLIAHFINLTISLALSYGRKNSDECLWYFVTNIFDNTIGVFICIVLLTIVENELRERRKFYLISGNYYKRIDSKQLSQLPPIVQSQIQKYEESQKNISDVQFEIKFQNDQNIDRKMQIISHEQTRAKANSYSNQYSFQRQPLRLGPHPQNIQKKSQQIISTTPIDEVMKEDNFIYIINYKAWIIQLCIWNGIVILGKIALFGLQFVLEKPLQDFSIFILGWIQKYPILELFVVIVIVPVIMNGLAYWVQDNFLMKKQKQAEEKNLLEQIGSNQPQNIIENQQDLILQVKKSLPTTHEKSDRRNQQTTLKNDHIILQEEMQYQQNNVQKQQNLDKFEISQIEK